MRIVRLVVAVFLLAGCATPPPFATEHAWVPPEDWWTSAFESGGVLVAPDGSLRHVKGEHARNLYEVARKIREQSAIAAQLALADSNDLNAFAAQAGGRRIVTLTLALLKAIGDDRDALATTLGHEIAHLHYAHGETRKERNQPAQGITYVLGSIAEGMPMAGLSSLIAVNTTFTRYEEREADLKGIEWAVEAGFSPCGSARTMRVLESVDDGTRSSPLLSTHPGHEERIARAIAMSRKLTGRGCGLPF